MSLPVIWLSCGVLQTELEELMRLGKISGRLHFLDSMLHIDPPGLETTLIDALKKLNPEIEHKVLVYGDCCPRMLNIVRQHRVGRVNAVNCAQMLTGRTRYRELMQEQSFIILPEWAPRWNEIFQIELGLTKDVAHDLMRDNHRNIVYLDTGLVAVPHPDLVDCAAYTGLPFRIESVSLDPLLEILKEASMSALFNK